MKPGTIIHTVAAVLSSVTALFSQSSPASAPEAKTKVSKKSNKVADDILFNVDPISFSPPAGPVPPAPNAVDRYPWRKEIVTTVFWIGEAPSANNPVPNHSSCWDKNWAKNYGGYDDPSPSHRRDMIPVKFTPKQNPFYCALPYNDKMSNGHKAEAATVIPWFKEAYDGPSKSVLKGRWIAIRKGDKTVYAQWEDAGPFRTDNWQYVFGHDRPKPNLNKGAGLDVSPAVRDYLGMKDTDVTDWKFVDFSAVPPGPWSKHGDNNTFVINQRKAAQEVAQARSETSAVLK